MAMRPLRDSDPAKYRLVTIRTDEARLWMVPSNNVNKLIGGIIARYQEIFKIEIYSYCVLSNHYHLLTRAPQSNLDEFEENVNREIARRMNWKCQRRGKFWARRYDDQEVKSLDDLLEAFLYVTTNSVRHGLVEDARDWPGLHSHHHCLDETDRSFSFTRYTVDQAPVTSRHTLRLSVLPQFKELSRAERRKLLKKLLDKRMETIGKQRREEGKGFLGVDKILSQIPGSYPQEVSRSKRPACYSKSAELRREHRASMRLRRESYRDASMRYRAGIKDVEFPIYSFKPPLHRLPRLFHFAPLPTDYFKNEAA